MQWVSKAVNYYKDINPSTLTGAIDVIVVERPTDSGGVELACSPFHVRFGKLSVLRPVDKKVRINVNDERVPFYMKVGETGEAFFVFETEDDVPADMQTSPLSGPVSDDGRSDAGEMEPLDLDAPALDQREGSLGDQEADEDQPITPTPSHPASPDSSRYVSLAGTQANSPTTSFRPFPGAPFLPNVGSGSPSRKSSAEVSGKPLVESPADEDGPGGDEGDASTKRKAYHVPTPFAAAAGKAAGLGAAAISRPVQELHDARLRARAQAASPGTAERRRRSLRDEHDLKGEPQELGQPSESMRADLAGLSLDGDKRDGQADPHHSDQTGDAVIRSARDRDADVRAMLGGKEGLGYAVGADGRPAEHEFSLRPFATGETKVDVGKHLRTSSGHEIGSAPENAGSLMLDMSGYKLDPGKEEGSSQSKRAQQEIEGSGAMVLDEKAEKEIIAFTQALLQSTDPTTLRSFFDEEENRSRASPPVPPLDLNDPRATPEPESKSGLPPRSRTSSRASSPPRPISIQDLHAIHADSEHASSPDDGVYHASPKQFTLKTGGSMHVFELSLCGSEGFDQLERAAVDRLFREHQVTFNEFMEQETIPDSPYLVVKYSSRYLTWDNASPVLASLAVYRKSLVEHPEHHRHVDESAQQSKASHRRGWSLWWGRGRSETPPATDATSISSMPTAETSPPTSPPESPPDSPRSLPVADTPPFSRRATDGDDEFPPEDHSKHYAKTLRLTSDQLKALGLKKGMNTISFSVRSSYSGYATCTSRIFLWESDFQVVISDIDGTITKSDALGHVFTMIGRDWTHLGVAKLYTDISRNGYKLMYLTSRAIGQADTTREYLKGIKQNGFQLPDGPVIMSPDRLMTSLHREVIMRKPEVFKMACLRDIQRLFGERSPFYAGFGNRITDALSYRSVDIPSSRIFTIDSNGEVKMELLELAGYKSSYIHMTDLVDQMFPPINRVSAPDYTDFNYWRTPLPSIDIDIPELQPPSPALSARSDQSTSRISLSRLGNLASSLSRRSSRNTLNDAASATSRTARGQTPTSPLLQATVPEEHGEEEEDDDESFLGNRSRSSSMPGSLPTESDFERYRAMASTASGRAQGTTEAEEYKKKVRAAGHADDDVDDEYDEDEAHDDEDVGEADDFGDQLDFSSVPYL
ncbi:phosphatidate phosphatase PAH1 [Rhodotorula paludigena]|uniref:phosphatidate phosphatase PAH1 n=1 Tax=Rhodotorula paludigena TaxID=86838 RepID=UPI00317946B6